MEFFQYETIHEAFGRNDFASLQYAQDGKAVGKVIVCFLSRFVILLIFRISMSGVVPKSSPKLEKVAGVPQAGKGTVRVFSERQPENMCLPK